MNMRVNPHLLDLSDKLLAPSLEVLSFILRHKELWPAGFVWDFGDCNQCAMGMADILWPMPPVTDPNIDGVEKAVIRAAVRFNVDETDAADLFALTPWAVEEIRDLRGRHLHFSEIKHARITPEMVADAIDAYCAETP